MRRRLMTKEELRGLLGSPDITIVDVRSINGWNRSDSKLPGAVREDPTDPVSWASQYKKDQSLVLYCA
jgi:hypothetical protein